MTTSLPELSASAVIALIESGGCTRDAMLTIARGFLPLEQNELIVVLSFLATSADEEAASLARASLAEMPARALFDFAADEGQPADRLVRLFGVVSDVRILEALVRNRAVPDDAVVALARAAEPQVQDVIVINQARILRAPEILDALLENPALSQDARRRVLETREEFFVKKAQAERRAESEAQTAEEEEPEVIDLPLEPIADLLARAAEQTAIEPPAIPLAESEKPEVEKRAIWARLQFMSVSEKVQLAFRGDRMIRMLLVRERNKLICTSVMRNPRLTEQEVESIAGMRNVEEEVLRLIGVRREWMGKYNIMLTLVRNPKAPIGVVLPFINRLTLRDLKGLKDDKGVPQVIREMAKKSYILRTQKS